MNNNTNINHGPFVMGGGVVVVVKTHLYATRLLLYLLCCVFYFTNLRVCRRKCQRSEVGGQKSSARLWSDIRIVLITHKSTHINLYFSHQFLFK